MSRNISKLRMLDRYNINPSDFLGSGMEAEVYHYGKHKVLKLYNDMSDINKQMILKEFYSKLESNNLSYELPFIHDIFEEDGMLITVEKHIHGINMENLFPKMSLDQQDKIMETYLQANLELKSLSKKSNINDFSLFDHQTPKVNCWFELLKSMVSSKQSELKHYFQRDVMNYNDKLHYILDILSAGYQGQYSLIHGDFYPGNLLVNDELKVTGLIDFGMLTMYGDSLFDVAIGWVCFDMYDELKVNISERYLNIIISTLGEDVSKKLYLYVLIYSFITANFYSKKCDDGHYQWCVENLNNQDYWKVL